MNGCKKRKTTLYSKASDSAKGSRALLKTCSQSYGLIGCPQHGIMRLIGLATPGTVQYVCCVYIWDFEWTIVSINDLNILGKSIFIINQKCINEIRI